MMQYMILTASVLVVVLSTGVNADGPNTRRKAAKLVDLVIPANGSKNEGPNTRRKADKLVDMIIPANGSKNEEEPGDTPVRAQAAGCDSYELYGCRYKKGIHGRYSKTSYTCSSKPVYSRYSSYLSKTVYLFYNSGYWAFHHTRCGSKVYVVSISLQSSFPDEVVSWKEVDTSGNWYPNSGIGVKCGSTPSTQAPKHAQGCDSYELYGCRYKEGIQGSYSKTSFTCYSKPVYNRYSSDYGKTVYLYYHSSSGLWAFSADRCSKSVYVASTSLQNNYPDDVVSWKEVDTSGNWYENSGIGVKCAKNSNTKTDSYAGTYAAAGGGGGAGVIILLLCCCYIYKK